MASEFISGDAAGNTNLWQKFVPTLFIGLGGSGKDVLMRLRRRLFDKYNIKRSEFLRFLVLDTNMQEWYPKGEAEEDYKDVELDVDEMSNCQIQQNDFATVFASLNNQVGRLYSGWLKPTMRNYGPESVIDGAGTHRQFGRMAFMLQHGAIRDKIERHIRDAMKYAGASPQDVLVPGGSVQSNVIEVVILTSLSGGTGSGMLLDTAYMVKDILAGSGHLTRYSTVIGFLPTMFEKVVDDAMYRKLQQNAYGTLLELEYYGTPRTGDELFIGNLADVPHHEKRRLDQDNRVGFHAPWRARGDEFIDGVGWEACYLVDNRNPLAMNAGLSPNACYQMTADYLFMDFEQSAFGINKRSVRSNLSQYKQGFIRTPIHRNLTDEEKTRLKDEIVKDRDVLFATHNGCTFNSFGLAEVSFDEARLYRAAGYRLAQRLVQERWQGDSTRPTEIDLTKWTQDDLFPSKEAADAGTPSFRPEALVSAFFETWAAGVKTGSLLDAIKTDFEAVKRTPPAKGTAALRSLMQKHDALLKDSAVQLALATNELRLYGDERKDGPLRAQLRELASRRIGQLGISASLELFKSYRDALKDVGIAAQKSGHPSQSVALARQEEADSVPHPVRGIAQTVEFASSCSKSEKHVRGEYRRAARTYIASLTEKLEQFVGGSEQKKAPDGLDKLGGLDQLGGTLYAQVKNADTFLKDLGTRLAERYRHSRTGESSERRQELSSWDDERYDEHINTALSNFIGKGAAGGHAAKFDWGRLQTKVLEVVRPATNGKMTGGTFADFIQYCFANQLTTSKKLPQVAELLGRACEKILRDAELNLKDFADGGVIDLLSTDNEPAQTRKIEKLIKFSAPYFALNGNFQRDVTGYAPKFYSILGYRAGNKKNANVSDVSAANAEEMVKFITRMSEAAGGPVDGQIHGKLQGNPSSLVLCREVWGLPLQHYTYLEDLASEYFNPSGGNRRPIDECHIDFHQAAENLPDVRMVGIGNHNLIRDNVKTVLLSLMTGTLFRGQDGLFYVRVPARIDFDNFCLGAKFNRVIKQGCEVREVWQPLDAEWKHWETKAARTPRLWAAAYLSAQRTYELSRQNIMAGGQNYAPPLRNCFELILDQAQHELQKTPEGRQWYAFLKFPDRGVTDAQQRIAARAAFSQRMSDEGVLVRISDNVPVFRIEEEKIDRFELPTTTESPQSQPV